MKEKISHKIITLGFAIVENDQIVHHWNQTGDSTYDTWLTRQLKDERHAQKGLVNFAEDGGKLIHYINEFHRLKRQRQIRGVDINQLDFPGLKSVVEANKTKISRKALEKGKVDLTASGNYQIDIYKSVNDAFKVAGHGEGTLWCTKNVDTARSYLQKGAMYVITKRGLSYAQLHVETQQYMDVNDSPIESTMWKELRENIPFINQLVNRMEIIGAMTADEIYSWIENQGSHIEGNLDLRETQIAKLPDSLVSVGGNLNLRGTQITKLPDSLVSIGGSLDLWRTPITKLPDSLVSVGGNLDLRYTSITKINDALVSVGGYLDLEGTRITKLPDSLVSIGDYLDLRGIKVTKLPDSLVSIGGSLDLWRTPITKLPDSLVSVGGYLDLRWTKVTKLPDSLVSVGGYFDLEKTKIAKLPDSLERVGGYLDLSVTKVTKLPDSLKSVGGYLNLIGTKIAKLPDSLIVKGSIYR